LCRAKPFAKAVPAATFSPLSSADDPSTDDPSAEDLIAGDPSTDDPSTVGPSADSPSAVDAVIAVARFAENIQIKYPTIDPERIGSYAATLADEHIFDLKRLRKHVKTLSNGAFRKYFTELGFHPFDAADLRIIPESQTHAEEHGTQALVKWLRDKIPDIVLPHKRLHIAEVLCANNVTCAARLLQVAGRGDAVPWLLSMEIDKLDVEDVCAKATALQAEGGLPAAQKPLPSLPDAVQVPKTGAWYDFDFLIFLLSEEMQKLLPDMTESASWSYSEELFAQTIYTVPRFRRQLAQKKKKEAWLRGMGWNEFDIADVLDIIEVGVLADMSAATPATRQELHGVAPLMQWMRTHVGSLPIEDTRKKYAEFLMAHNVATVHRLIVRGGSEAWLMSIGFHKLDAADCVAVLKTLARTDPLVVAKAKKAAADAEKSANELAQRKAERERIIAEAMGCVLGCVAAIGSTCTGCAEGCWAIAARVAPQAASRYAECSHCIGACCVEWGNSHYPGKFWLPDTDPRADVKYSIQRDAHSSYGPYCSFCISPLTLDMCCCAMISRGDVHVIARLICCPMLYMLIPFSLLNDHVSLNLSCGWHIAGR
jgi:hypothetical protein